MGETRFDVLLTDDAWSDLADIDAYWTEREEAWRGEKYYYDLRDFALRELGNCESARRGRRARNTDRSGVKEILAFGIYRIIYEIDEAASRVNILRFWHAHRDDLRREF